MEGAIPHGLETVESPTGSQKGKRESSERSCGHLSPGTVTVSNTTEFCANTSNVSQPNNRAEPLSPRRRR